MAWYENVPVVEAPDPWHESVPVVDPEEESGLLDRLVSGPGAWLARNNPWAMGNRERYGDALVDMAAQGAEDVREADWGQIGREALETVEGVSARAVGGRARPSADVAASDLGRSFTGAAAQGLGGTAEGLDTLGRSAWWLGTGDVVDPTLLGRAGAAVSGLAETEALTPERPEHFASQFGGAGGSMTTFLGTGLLGRAGAAGLASRLGASGQTASRAGQAGQFGAAGTMAGSLGAQEAHDRVMQFMAENPELGMTEEDALRMAPQGVLPGLVQVANLNILLRPLSGWAKKSVAKKVTQDLLAAGASEFTVESAGAVLQNAVERQYNVDRELMDGALAQGGYAALSAIALRTGALPYTTRQESGPELVRDTVRRLAEGENPQTVVAEIVNEVNPDTVAEADRAGAFDIDFGQIGQLTDERGFVYDTTADGLPVAGRPVQEEQAWAEQRESDRLDAELRREFDWQRAEEQRVRERGRQEREADYQRQLQPDPTGRFASGVDAERGRPRGDLPENPAMREAFAAALQGPPEFASGFLAADQQMRGQESAGVQTDPTPRPGPETASPASPESQNLRFRPDGSPYRTERGVRNAIAREGLAAEPVEVPDGWAINLAETDSQNRETDRQNQFSQTAPEAGQATDPVATEGLPRIRQDGQWLPFPDARLKRREYRQALARMPTELTRGGGIALVPRQGAQRSHRGMPTGDITWDYDAQDLVRTPSVNPGWFQSLAAEENVTVADIGRIVDKALAGENLGVRQQRVVEALLNNVWAGRVTDGGADQGFGPDFESLGERLSAARDLRRAARGEPTDTEADAEAQRQQAESDEMAGMRYAEEVYLADMDAEARALYELAEDARAQDEAATMEALDREQSDIELARELWNISQGARDDTEATTRTGQEEPGTQPRQGPAAARESEEPVPATEPAGRTEPEQQDLTGEAAPTESQQALERRRRETEERLRGRTDAAPDEGEGDLFTDPEFDSARRQQELAPDEAEPGETTPPARSRQAPQEAPAPAGVSRSGPRYSFAGERAQTADQNQLSDAKRRLEAGEAAETIRQETGWFQGDDGRWRFEIDDSGARFNPTAEENAGSPWGKLWNERLDRVIFHPKLFDAYPEMKAMPVSTVSGLESNGEYRRSMDLLDPDAEPEPGIVVNADVSDRQQFSTILHEIQHAIQDSEGLASGGSSAQFRPGRATSRSEMARIEDEARRLYEDFRERANQQRDDPLPNWANADTSARREFMDRASGSLYRRLSGEVEARNVQARQGMTARERRQTSPDRTRDTPVEDVIVVYNGDVMEGAPPPANAIESPAPVEVPGIGVDQATEALRGALSPRGFRNLVEAGPVRVVSSPTEVPGTHPADAAGVAVDGQIYLVADNLRDPAHVRAVLLHELGVHHGLREMLGDDYRTLIDQLRRQVERGGREGAGRAAREAWSAHQRALADETIRDEDTRWEETVAYLAESGSDTPLLRRILAAIRNFLRRYGLVRKFTAADVAQIARGSVRRAARQEAPDQGAPVRGGQAAAALSRAPVKVPDRTWRWMGFDGPQRLVADFQELARRHPEHYESGREARDDVEFVLDKPENWYPHAAGRFTLVRQGELGQIPAVRVDFRRMKDGAFRVASVYRMTDRQVSKKMRDKRKKVDEALGGNPSARVLPSSTGPGMPTVRDYLEAVADRSSPPESPSGDSASSEGTVPPEPDTGQGRYSRAVALDDVLGRVLTRRLERDGDASPEVFRDPARWRDRNVFNALRRARSHLKSTAGIVADDRVAAEFLAQAAEGRVGDALAGSGKVLAARDQAGELVGTAERTGQGFNLAVQHGLGVGFKSTRTLPGAKRALGGETTAESVFDPPIESGPLDLDGRSYLGEVGSWLRWKAQDKLNSLKRLQDAVEKRRGKLSESANAYVAEELYHGRARDRIDRFDDEHVDPLLRAVQESGYTLEQVEQYLYARHAPEANAKLAEINPGEDAMSGMSDAGAAEIMADLREQGDFEALEAIGERVDAMNRATRELLVESGLETPETIQAWEDAYEFYVPLKGPPGGREAATGLPRRGRGYDTRGDASKRRLGRRSKARDILANVVAGHYSTVQRAEKARVGRALLEFARQNPDERLWTIDQPMTRRGIDPATGLVRNFGDPAQKQQDNVFVVREDGIEHHIVFNTENVDAMRIARAVKNLGADDMGIVTRGLLMFNRYLSMMSTSMNPEFVVSNFTRDLQTAFINLNDTEAAAMKGRVIRDVGKAFRAIRRHQKGKAETAWGRSYAEFRAEGGQTGWMEGYRDVSDLARSLTKKLDQHRPGSWGFARRAGRNVLEFVNNMNTAVENAVRLSAYHHARKSGVSRMKAASLAKNLTVNFNRKGDAGNVLNAFYLFYNAAVQGNARIIQAAARSPKARKFMYASVAFGAVLDMANRMYAGEDEDGENRYDQIPEWIKSMNWVVMMPPGESLPDWVPDWMRGDGNYLKIPLPYGYNVLNYAGQKASRAAWSGQIPDYSPAREAGQLAMSITDAFNPIGASPSLLQLVSPTITDPAVQWAENKNFAGIPLHKEPSPFGPPPPNHTLHFNGARGWSRWITRNLNELTGGSEVTPGAVDINPELVDHLSDFLAGGAGRFTAETLDLPRKILSDEEVESHEIPFVGRLWGSPRTDASRSLFFERLRDLEYLDRELDLAQENREFERARELRREFRDEFRLIDQGKDFRRDAKELSDTIEALEQAEDRTEAQDRHLERLRERRDGIYSRFNRAYRDTVIEQ